MNEQTGENHSPNQNKGRRIEISLPVAATLLAVVLLWSYWPTLRAVTERWAHDPQYTHAFFVPFFAGLVLWSRRGRWADDAPRPSWWGIPILALACLLHLMGGYWYFEWLNALSLLPAVAGLVVLFAGPPGWRWAWPAIFFLAFALPIPYQLEVSLAHPLQRIATVCSTYCLQTLGVPALAEGNIILIGDRQLGVAEACSGLGMLVTFFALTTAVALMIRRPLADRAVIVLSAVPIGVLANVFRITATGLLLPVAGHEVANTIYHDLAGWLMMPFAIGLLWLEFCLVDHLLSIRGPGSELLTCDR
jgi:exosortase